MIHNCLQFIIGYFNKDMARIHHAMKVYTYACAIARAENLSEYHYNTIAYTALLHDIGIVVAEKKYNSCAGKYQEIEGPSVARSFLETTNCSNQQIDRICYIIGRHHTYSAIDNIDFQILVEADFLVNIFEENITLQAIENISKTYFKTEFGKQLLTQLYLNI